MADRQLYWDRAISSPGGSTLQQFSQQSNNKTPVTVKKYTVCTQNVGIAMETGKSRKLRNLIIQQHACNYKVTF